MASVAVVISMVMFHNSVDDKKFIIVNSFVVFIAIYSSLLLVTS